MAAHYFAYGSNMSSARLTGRVAGVAALGPARLEGWQLVLDKPSRDGSAKANLVSVPGRLVWGVVWTIPEPAWSVLDGYEPGYERIACALVDARGRPVDAQTYVYRGERTAEPAFAWYVEHLIAGAVEHGLPDAYCRRLAALRADARSPAG